MFQVFSRCTGQKRPHQSAGKIFQIQKSKADWEFLLYPVCLGLIFIHVFMQKYLLQCQISQHDMMSAPVVSC